MALFSSDRLYPWLVSVLFLADRMTKWYAVYGLADHDVVVNNYLSFSVCFNRGFAWSIGSSVHTLVFLVVSAIIGLVTGILILYTYKRWCRNLPIIGELMVITGALSNMFDRVLYGGVADFIVLSYGNWSWPSFNIADVAIVVGILIMLYSVWTEDV
jgi:signal peptidase II